MATKKKQSRREEHKRFERTQAGFKRLLTVKKTEPFTLFCPVCGEEITAQAIASQGHWAHDDFEFSMRVVHHCPAIVKSYKEACLEMYGPWLQDWPFPDSPDFRKHYEEALEIISKE